MLSVVSTVSSLPFVWRVFELHKPVTDAFVPFRRQTESLRKSFWGRALSSGSLPAHCATAWVCVLGILTTRRALTGDIFISTKTQRNGQDRQYLLATRLRGVSISAFYKLQAFSRYSYCLVYIALLWNKRHSRYHFANCFLDICARFFFHLYNFVNICRIRASPWLMWYRKLLR